MPDLWNVVLAISVAGLVSWVVLERHSLTRALIYGVLTGLLTYQASLIGIVVAVLTVRNELQSRIPVDASEQATTEPRVPPPTLPVEERVGWAFVEVAAAAAGGGAVIGVANWLVRYPSAGRLSYHFGLLGPLVLTTVVVIALSRALSSADDASSALRIAARAGVGATAALVICWGFWILGLAATMLSCASMETC